MCPRRHCDTRSGRWIWRTWRRSRRCAGSFATPCTGGHATDIERLVGGYEWSLGPTRHGDAAQRPDAPVNAVAWNIERGKRFEAVAGLLRGHPELAGADLVLLTEVDVGMGRSGNRNVAAALARRLGLGYVYVNAHLMLSPGDESERGHGVANALALHGSALLTRFSVLRVQGVALPEYYAKFHTPERRLGHKHAVVCEVALPGGPATVAVVHLDPFAPPRHRMRQLVRVLRVVERFGNPRVLLGGDLNTSTYDLGSRLGLTADLLTKYLRDGFDGTLAHYMTPERRYERHVFRALAAAGLEVDGYNDRTRGTLHYDVADPLTVARTRAKAPGWAVRWLARRLEPYGGVAPLRFDWFAGRGFRPEQAGVVERASFDSVRPSDHNPIRVTLR